MNLLYSDILPFVLLINKRPTIYNKQNKHLSHVILYTQQYMIHNYQQHMINFPPALFTPKKYRSDYDPDQI